MIHAAGRRNTLDEWTRHFITGCPPHTRSDDRKRTKYLERAHGELRRLNAAIPTALLDAAIAQPTPETGDLVAIVIAPADDSASADSEEDEANVQHAYVGELDRHGAREYHRVWLDTSARPHRT